MTRTARHALRHATAEAHDRVDRLFAAYALDERESYGRFLAAHAAAFLPVEAALDEAGVHAEVADWPERRRAALILADLETLGIALPAPIAPPPLPDPAARLGAVYVLEGSRLGGTMLARDVPDALPKRYLSGERQASWPVLTALLDRELAEPAALAAATEAALATFARFEDAAIRFAPGA